MKLTSRKILGFFVLMVILTAIFFILRATDPGLLEVLGSKIIDTMFYAFIVLVTGNTAVKAIKSIWFKKGLCENGESDKEN